MPTFSERFEKKFVFRPFEPDGDYSWKPETNPYAIKSFFSFQGAACLEEIERISTWPEPQPGAGAELGALAGTGMYLQYDADKKKHERQIKEIQEIIKKHLL